MKSRIFKIVAVGAALLVVVFLAVQLFSHHSPTVDILGSYFPAWMVCIVSGLMLTLIAHWIVQSSNLKSYLGPAPLIYSCLMIIFTFTTWILVLPKLTCIDPPHLEKASSRRRTTMPWRENSSAGS